MSWRTIVAEIVSKLKSDLVALTDATGTKIFDTVYVGRSDAPKSFPCAFILADRVRETAASAGTSFYRIDFEIRVISRNPSSEAGLKDVMDRLGYVEEMLINDRTFGGKSDNLEVREIRPEVRMRITRDRHEGSLFVSFERII